MRWMMVVVILILGACGPREGFLGNPLTRSISWFSTVGGDDIRAACRPGAPDRARLIYNAAWGIQVRVYELASGPPGDGARLSGFVFAEPDLRVVVFDNLAVGGPWDGAFASTRLAARETDRLWAALRADGLGGPSPAGLDLPSWGTWWAASACLDGRFAFMAWAHPGAAFSRLGFAPMVFAQDPVRIGVLPPGTGQPPVMAGRDATNTGFTLRVGRSGLVGTLGL